MADARSSLARVREARSRRARRSFRRASPSRAAPCPRCGGPGRPGSARRRRASPRTPKARRGDAAPRTNASPRRARRPPLLLFLFVKAFRRGAPGELRVSARRSTARRVRHRSPRPRLHRRTTRRAAPRPASSALAAEPGGRRRSRKSRRSARGRRATARCPARDRAVGPTSGRPPAARRAPPTRPRGREHPPRRSIARARRGRARAGPCGGGGTGSAGGGRREATCEFRDGTRGRKGRGRKGRARDAPRGVGIDVPTRNARTRDGGGHVPPRSRGPRGLLARAEECDARAPGLFPRNEKRVSPR